MLVREASVTARPGSRTSQVDRVLDLKLSLVTQEDRDQATALLHGLALKRSNVVIMLGLPFGKLPPKEASDASK